MPLDLVMPVWWGSHPQWGLQLLNNLVMEQLSITVMNYRTSLNRLRAEPLPF